MARITEAVSDCASMVGTLFHLLRFAICVSMSGEFLPPLGCQNVRPLR